jgi:hypothetical protein
MPELSPAVFPRLVGELIEGGNLALERACARVVTAVQREARERLAESTHRYGEPTDAAPGGPPALVSGTLRRSVVHTEPHLAGPMTWEAKVGLAAGFFPPYGGERTASSKYGLYLEAGLRNGTTYPWFIPAWRDVMEHEAPRIFREAFATTRWPHIF